MELPGNSGFQLTQPSVVNNLVIFNLRKLQGFCPAISINKKERAVITVWMLYEKKIVKKHILFYVFCPAVYNARKGFQGRSF